MKSSFKYTLRVPRLNELPELKPGEHYHAIESTGPVAALVKRINGDDGPGQYMGLVYTVEPR